MIANPPVSPEPSPVTVANTCGSTAHLSPVLRKARRLGFPTAHSLLCLAVTRGCRHYAPASFDTSLVNDPGLDRLDNAELGIALVSGAQDYSPQLIRCAAQLLSDPRLETSTLTRLAKMERCEPVLHYIAEQARQWDEGRETHWAALQASLSPRRSIPAGVWPHPDRFLSVAGYRRGGGAHKPVWLRPSAATTA